MAFTKAQLRKVEEIKQIAELCGANFWSFEDEKDNEVRGLLLDVCRDRLLSAAVVSEYVLMDELLTELMARHFFDPTKSSIELWKTKQFKTFNYYVVEEMPLMRKLALVKSIRKIPKSVEETIRLTNLLRNALAHSFFPMNKRDFKRSGKVTYKGKDLYTVEGMRRFSDDANEAIGFLGQRAFATGRTRKRVEALASG